MAHSKIIQAIKIYLDVLVTETPSMGIYTSGDLSEIRLSEENMSGVSLEWTHGLIAKNGIGAIKESGDTRRGGCPVNYDGLNIDLIDTNQYLLALKDLGIYLPGCSVEIYEFRGTESDNDSTSETLIYTGIVEDMNWNEAVLSIPVKNSRYKRSANITRVAENGAVIPVTFGSLYPTFDASGNIINKSIAKFVRTVNKQDDTAYTNATITQEGLYSEIKKFPVVALRVRDGESIPRGICIGVSGTPLYGDYRTTAVVDTYIILKDGTGSGQIRSVFEIEWGVSWVCFWMDSILKTDASIATDGSRTWVQIVKYQREYRSDLWTCKSFLQSNTGSEISEKEIFVESDNDLEKIANYGLKITDSNKNNVNIDGNQYNSNFDNLKSFLILPVSNLSLITDSTLSKYEAEGSAFWSGMSKLHDGIYANRELETNFTISSSGGLENPENAYDKDSETFAQFDVQYSYPYGQYMANDYWYAKALKFDLPEIPVSKVNISKIYIGIKMSSYWHLFGWCQNDDRKTIRVGFNRFMLSKPSDFCLYKLIYNENQAGWSNHFIDDIPDFYTNGDGSNIKFYRESSPTGGVFSDIFGYTIQDGFSIDAATDFDTYNLYQGGSILLRRRILKDDVKDDGLSGTDCLKIYEIAVIVEMSDASISDKIFIPLSGRIFNDTWITRKIPGNLIAKPVEILEHVKRLQNWSETGETGIEWGKEYATTARIKIAGEGSFDSDHFLGISTETPAFQLFDENECQTDVMTKKLCQTYGINNYIDTDGTECIETLEKTNPTETISFADINGDIGNVEEPQIADVYCEPSINYLFNCASDKYDASLRVFNISNYVKSSNWASCSSGFANQTDAESVLDLAFALWQKHRQVENAPSDFTDIKFIVTYADALAYLIRKLSWMSKRRISLSVFYTKGSAYHFGQHLLINLPHQTGGEDIECIIESVTKDKNGNNCNLNLVLLDDIPAL